MNALIVAALILTGYAASLWWLLRRESTPVRLLLAVLFFFALLLRLVHTSDFPRGYNEDEVKQLAAGMKGLRDGRLTGNGPEGPYLLQALFEAPLVPWFGTGRWTLRTYSNLTGALSAPVAFAVARALGLHVAPALAAGAFVAVLPWSLFYGRVSIGAEMVFHQMLLLAALARLLRGGGWADVGVGSFALTLLLYDYPCGRAMVPMTFMTAVLARRWQDRLRCVLVAVLAALAFIPQVRVDARGSAVGFSGVSLHAGLSESPLQILESKTARALQSLVEPVAADYWMTVRSAARHPHLVLALAGLGVFTGVRRGLFLLAGFITGLAPAVVSWGDWMSAHRMLMAFAFISLAAACALNLLPWRRLRGAVAAAAVLVTSVQSVRMYFSDDFWPPSSRGIFDFSSSELIDAIPLRRSGPLILDGNLLNFFAARSLVDNQYQILDVTNWYPPAGVPSVYAFSKRAVQLQPFYLQLLGLSRVRIFGESFLVTYEASDWTWLRAHGWTYEARCQGRVWRTNVPTLVHVFWTFRDLYCRGPVEHRWRGRWNGSAARLKLFSSGSAVVETSSGYQTGVAGAERTLTFDAEPGVTIEVTVSLPTSEGLVVGLQQITPAGPRVPPWEYVDPVAEE